MNTDLVVVDTTARHVLLTGGILGLEISDNLDNQLDHQKALEI